MTYKNVSEKEVLEALLKKIGVLRCYMCHKCDYYELTYTMIPIHKPLPDIMNLPTIYNSMSFIPVVNLNCKTCGYLTQHDLFSLGLVQQDNEDK